jgi:hypothetical protein
MIAQVLYEVATGNIISAAIASSSAFALQPGAGQAILSVDAGTEVVSNPGKYRVVDGTLVRPTARLRSERTAKIKAEAQARILERYPIWKQLNAALGLLSAEETDEIKAFIQSVRGASDTAEEQVAGLNADGDVDNFTW